MRPDLRAPLLGAVAWAAALAALASPGWLAGPFLLVLTVVVLRALLGPGAAGTSVGWLLTAAAVTESAALHQQSATAPNISDLAEQRATVTGSLVVRSDPVAGRGPHTTYVHFRATLLDVTGRGRRVRLRTPVVVIADPRWQDVQLGSRLRVAGRLDRSDGGDLAAVLIARGPPHVVAEAGRLLAAVDQVRAGIRAAVAGQPRDPRTLVPALVDGDDGGLSDDVSADFRTAGLTHLLAVSGTNLTLIVGFLLIMARWCGVRARGLVLVGVLGVIGFVLLARTEPSVLRAAVMGSVALVGMGTLGRERGTRALGIAVVVLLLLDPWLARSAGFALSVCATGGILYLAPGWRDALRRWLPGWAAEAIAVPLAAQLACSPLVPAISGQVSLVAVAANMLVAWAVGPATVLGLAGGLLTLAWAPVGRLCGTLASWCVAWLVTVARHGAALPTAAVGWGTGPVALALLVVVSGALALAGPGLLRRPATALGATGVL